MMSVIVAASCQGKQLTATRGNVLDRKGKIKKKKKRERKKQLHTGRQMMRLIADGWRRLQDKSSEDRFLIDSRVKRSWALQLGLLHFALLCPALPCFALLCLALPCFALLCPTLLCFTSIDHRWDPWHISTCWSQDLTSWLWSILHVCECVSVWFTVEALSAALSLLEEEFYDQMTSARYNAMIQSLTFHRQYCSQSS